MFKKCLLSAYRRLFNSIHDKELENVLLLIDGISNADIKKCKLNLIRRLYIQSNFDNLGQWGESIDLMISYLVKEQIINDGFYKNMDSKTIYLDDWLIDNNGRVGIKKASNFMNDKIKQLIYNINGYYHYNIDYYRYYKRLNKPHYLVIKQWNEIITKGDI